MDKAFSQRHGTILVMLGVEIIPIIPQSLSRLGVGEDRVVRFTSLTGGEAREAVALWLYWQRKAGQRHGVSLTQLEKEGEEALERSAV